MKASYVIPKTGEYLIIVAPALYEKDAPQMQMRVYRNRVRLLATESTYESRWRGMCEKDDLIEADGEFDLALTVVEEVTQPGDLNHVYAPPKDARYVNPTDSGNDAAEPPVAHV